MYVICLDINQKSIEMNLLDKLAIKYGSDKSSRGHGYTKYYAQYFDSIRKNCLRILELGVREGYSLRMWHDYFENSIIVGVDNNLEGLCPKNFIEERIIFKLGSQDDDVLLNNICDTYGLFDIIIDDCSHISPLTIKSFEILFPKLNIGGFYVIEDLQVCDYDKHYLPYGKSTKQYLASLSNKKIFLNKIGFIKKCL